jgi:hypothetical protein
LEAKVRRSANGIATEALVAEPVPAMHPVLVAVPENPLVGWVAEGRGLPTRPLTPQRLLPEQKALVRKLRILGLVQPVKRLTLLRS